MNTKKLIVSALVPMALCASVYASPKKYVFKIETGSLSGLTSVEELKEFAKKCGVNVDVKTSVGPFTKVYNINYTGEDKNAQCYHDVLLRIYPEDHAVPS